jgi:hypothetical protein
MDVNLHIERLVLDGLPVTTHQGPSLEAALKAELVRLLSARDFSGTLWSGESVPALIAPSIQLTPGSNPIQFGRQIARSVYQGLGASK